MTSANFAPVAGTDYGVYDQISRPDEQATANFVNLDNTWNATDALTFFGQVGYSWGDGKTPEQDVSETSPGIGTGASYQLNGIGSGPSFNLGNQINTTPTPGGVPVAFGWIFGDQNIDVKDTETWAKIDSDFKMHDDSWTDLKFGARFEKHDRTSANVIGQGPTAAVQSHHAGLSDGRLLELPVELQYLRRLDSHRDLVLVAGAIAGLRQPDQREPRSGHPLGLELHVFGV